MKSVFKSEKRKQALLASYDALLAQWQVPYKTDYIPTTWGKTFCVKAGDPRKPPLLLFHGVGDNLAVMWLSNIEELARHFFCVAVDTLGGPGRSEPNDRFYQDFDQTDWITEVIDALGQPTVNLAGVSNGGYMAYHYLVQRPDRVKKIVCIEGGMVTHPLKAIFRTLKLMFPEILVPSQKNMKKILSKLSSPDSVVYEQHPEIVDHAILAMKSHRQSAMFMHKVVKYDPAKDTALRNRMYFLMGDYLIKDEQERISLLDTGGYKYKVIPHAGHGLNCEQADITNREIIGFLA
jgi:pimeloyl-ACP methyl ester carboxylesterase